MSKGRPQIFNTDQDSQFTSEAFTSMLLAQGVQVSMDGRGRCMDNVFVERLWRSIKYEEAYLKAYQNGTEARKGIGAYLAFYNQERPHQALGYWSPGQVFQAEPVSQSPLTGFTLGGQTDSSVLWSDKVGNTAENNVMPARADIQKSTTRGVSGF